MRDVEMSGFNVLRNKFPLKTLALSCAISSFASHASLSFPFVFGGINDSDPKVEITNINTNSDDPRAMAVANDGSLYIGGAFLGQDINFSANLSDSNSKVSSFLNQGDDNQYTHDGFLTAYRNGVELDWIIAFQGHGSDKVGGVTTDGDGNIYVTGYFRSEAGDMIVNKITSKGTVSQLGSFATTNDETRAFVAKFTDYGALTWFKVLDGNGSYSYSDGNSIGVDNTGNVYVGGTFSDTIDFDPNAGEHFITSQDGEFEGNTDAFVLKLASDGSFVWVKAYGSENDGEEINGIAIDSDDGSVYITGDLSADTDGVNLNGDSASLDFNAVATANADKTGVASGNYFGFVQKLESSTGAIQWSKTLLATEDSLDSNNNISAITFNPVEKSLFVAGAMDGRVDFDPNASILHTSASVMGAGDYDSFVLKLDQNGNYVWHAVLGNAAGGTDEGIDALHFGNGRLYVSGDYEGSVTSGSGTAANVPTWAGNIPSSNGGQDALLLQLDAADGSFKWARNIGGTDYDTGDSFAQNLEGNVFFAGQFKNTIDLDPTTGVLNKTAQDGIGSGGRDAFVVKLTESGDFIAPSGDAPTYTEFPAEVTVEEGIPTLLDLSKSLVANDDSNAITLRLVVPNGRLFYQNDGSSVGQGVSVRQNDSNSITITSNRPEDITSYLKLADGIGYEGEIDGKPYGWLLYYLNDGGVDIYVGQTSIIITNVDMPDFTTSGWQDFADPRFSLLDPETVRVTSFGGQPIVGYIDRYNNNKFVVERVVDGVWQPLDEKDDGVPTFPEGVNNVRFKRKKFGDDEFLMAVLSDNNGALWSSPMLDEVVEVQGQISVSAGDFDFSFENNLAYLAYRDALNNNRLTIFQDVNNPVTDLSRDEAENIVVTQDANGKPYVAYTQFGHDLCDGSNIITFNAEVSAWQQLGNICFNGSIEMHDIVATADGTVYYAYVDYSFDSDDAEGGSTQINVQRYTPQGGWQRLGQVGFDTRLDQQSYIDLEIKSDGTPVIAYTKFVDSGSLFGEYVVVQEYVNDKWQDVEDRYFSDSESRFAQLELINDKPFVSYIESPMGEEYLATVKYLGRKSVNENYHVATNSNTAVNLLDDISISYQRTQIDVLLTLSHPANGSLTATVSNGVAGNYQNGVMTLSGDVDAVNDVFKTVKFVPNINYSGNETYVSVVAVDRDQPLHRSQSFDVTIDVELYVAPVAITGNPSRKVAEGATYSFTPTVSGATSTVNYSIYNKPYWASFNTKTGTLSGKPDYNSAGNYSNIVITATVENGSASLNAFNITVLNTNLPPAISGTPTTTAKEGSLYSFTPVAIDTDGSIKSFAVSGLPSWANFNPLTGTISGQPGISDIGTYNNIVISVTDSDGATSSLSGFTIVVDKVNDRPTVSSLSLSINEDSIGIITPVGADADGDDLTFSIVTNPVNGHLSQMSGKWQYSPNENFVGNDSFTYVANDGEVDSLPATVTVNIASVNDRPVANDDTISAVKSDNNQYQLNVLSNDSDVDGDSIKVSGAGADVGQVSFNAEQLTYVAENGFVGTVNLFYAITDSNGGTDTAIVNLTITSSDGGDGPVITVPEDIEINATGLYTKAELGVATAVDKQGQPLPVSLVDGKVMYPPGNNLAYWQSENTEGIKSVATQNVKVHPLVSISKDQTVIEGNQVSVSFILNGNSPQYPVVVPFLVEGSAQSVLDHSLSTGTVEIGESNQATITFDVFEDAIAEDNEYIVISLGAGINASANASQTITISEGNAAPEVVLAVSQGGENRLIISKGNGMAVVEASVSDLNVGDTHSFQWHSDDSSLDPLLSNADGSRLDFDPSDLSIGSYSINIDVTDNGVPSKTTRATVFVEVVDSLVVLDGKDTDGDLIPDSEEGFGDSDGDGIPNYQDAIDECNVLPEQLINQRGFLIEGEPGVCLRKGSTIAGTESGSALIGGTEVLTNLGEDEEAVNVGGVFDFVAYGLPQAGQTYQIVLPQQMPIPNNAIYRKYSGSKGWFNFVENADNQLHSTQGEPGYCPPPGDELWTQGLTQGHWCVQLTISDGGPNDDDGQANNAIVDPGGVAVLKTDNTSPVANDDLVELLWNTESVIDVIHNDNDADGDDLSLSSAVANFGAVEIVNNQLVYVPAQDFVGQDVITYTIVDGNGGVASAKVRVSVISNQIPEAVDDSASTNDRTAISIDVLANDIDADGDLLTINEATAEFGKVEIKDKALHYTPKPGFGGVDIIEYTVSDGRGGEVKARVEVSVQAYETVTVTNKSSGGAIAVWFILLLGALGLSRASLSHGSL